jgi:predicted amidophosphoribosyltransferase
MGERVCYRAFCPDCDAPVSVADETCPDCDAALTDRVEPP